MSRNDFRVLEWLQAQPRSFEELRLMVAGANGEDCSRNLDKLLETLEHLGLLKVVPGPDAH